MTRVIAGIARGRRLLVPPGRVTRPTSDRAREGLFGTVESALGSLRGARVLDLYAGSGAVGLEALSRGAAHAVLVESAPAAIRAIYANIAGLGLPGACLVADRVERVLARGPDTRRYEFVFADPPYAADDHVVATMLDALLNRGWLAEGALVAVERATGSGPLDWPAGFAADRARRYGDATLWYGLAAGGQAG